MFSNIQFLLIQQRSLDRKASITSQPPSLLSKKADSIWTSHLSFATTRMVVASRSSPRGFGPPVGYVLGWSMVLGSWSAPGGSRRVIDRNGAHLALPLVLERSCSGPYTICGDSDWSPKSSPWCPSGKQLGGTEGRECTPGLSPNELYVSFNPFNTLSSKIDGSPANIA
jgi:hypothetical protein